MIYLNCFSQAVMLVRHWYKIIDTFDVWKKHMYVEFFPPFLIS